MPLFSRFFFFFNDTATTEIYTLSLHDALPIFRRAADAVVLCAEHPVPGRRLSASRQHVGRSEEHTSELSHVRISYAVFCLKKKKKKKVLHTLQKKKKKNIRMNN